jgi:hypothetical protein
VLHTSHVRKMVCEERTQRSPLGQPWRDGCKPTQSPIGPCVVNLRSSEDTSLLSPFGPHRRKRQDSNTPGGRGKDDDLQELLNDIAADGTRPNDGEFCVSRHQLTPSAVCVLVLYLHYLSGRHPSAQRHAYEDNRQLGGLAWKTGIEFQVAAQYVR